MHNTQTNKALTSDQLNLFEIWEALWAGKWLIVSVTALFAIVSIVSAKSMTNIYRAEVLLAPANEGSSSPLGGIARQLGGLARFSGSDLSDQKSTNALATLQSRAFTIRFIQKYELIVPLIAGTWSREQGRSIIDPKRYDVKRSEWLKNGSPSPKATPTYWDAYKAFNNIRYVEKDHSTGLVTIAIEWRDPKQAQLWANALVEEINKHLKQQDIEESRRSIKYLKAKLSETPLVGVQQVFYKLIESQTKSLMLTDVRDEYAFEVIDPAVLPQVKIKPRRAMIVVISTLFGGIISTMIVLIRFFYRKYR